MSLTTGSSNLGGGGGGGAPIDSPHFTGVPTAPTAAPGDNTTQIATDAFVTAAVAAGGGNPITQPGQMIAGGVGGAETAITPHATGDRPSATVTPNPTDYSIKAGDDFGSGDPVSVVGTDAGMPAGAAPFAMAVWQRSASVAAPGDFMSWGAGDTGNVEIYKTGGRLHIISPSNGSNVNGALGSEANLDDHKDHLVVASSSGALITGYIDAVALDSPIAGVLDIVLGGAYGLGYGVTVGSYDGYYGRPLAIDREMTATEVDQLYAAQGLSPAAYDAFVVALFGASLLHYHPLQGAAYDADMPDLGTLNIPTQISGPGTGRIVQQQGFLTENTIRFEPPPSFVETVTGAVVDNADPQNPVVNADLAGAAAGALAAAEVYTDTLVPPASSVGEVLTAVSEVLDFSVTSTGASPVGVCSDAGLPIGAAPWTAGLWMRPTSDANVLNMVWGHTGSAQGAQFGKQTTEMSLYAPSGVFNGGFGPNPLPNDVWYLIGLSYDMTHLHANINGAEVANLPGILNLIMGGQIQIGGTAVGDQERAFFLDRYISPAEWAALYAANTLTAFNAAMSAYSPLHYWPMQEAAGDFADLGSLNIPLTAGGGGLTYQQPGALTPAFTNAFAAPSGGGATGNYGTGADGAVVAISGSLTADVNATTYEVPNGVTVDTCGYAIRATTSITIDAGGVIEDFPAVSKDGTDGDSGGGPGGDYGGGATFAPGQPGVSGAVGPAAGNAGQQAAADYLTVPGNADPASGDGGNAAINAGGAGNSAINTTTSRSGPFALLGVTFANLIMSPIGSSSGGSGGVDDANTSGGSGAGGGYIVLAAPSIVNNGQINAPGGNGGAAAAASVSCGGSGGGVGGKIVLLGTVTGAGTTDVSGGTGSAGTGTGTAGTDGDDGLVLVLSV